MDNPIVHIKIGESARAISGAFPINEIPSNVLSADIHIDWENESPVIVDLRMAGKLAVDVAAGVRSIEIGGKHYRLIETDHVKPMPDSSAPQLHD